jgi:polysaccharide pyruvyl transferase WcaK-like protein
MGQGFEPIDNPALRARAQSVLPELDLVGCREKKFGPVILQSLGVNPTKIVVTGDDAIELGYRWRVAALGNGIGANLRVAWYAGVNKDMIEIVRDVLQGAARKHAAPLAPIPIATRCPSDASHIQKLLAGYGNVLNEQDDLAEPRDVIRQTGLCRVVVTGSYHAAVFALSQGISAVCLSQTAYYVKKFLGLNAQFGDGCYVLTMDDVNFRDKLVETIDQAWELAEQYRPQLLDAAEQQVRAGQEAYRRVFEQVEQHRARSQTAQRRYED